MPRSYREELLAQLEQGTPIHALTQRAPIPRGRERPDAGRSKGSGRGLGRLAPRGGKCVDARPLWLHSWSQLQEVITVRHVGVREFKDQATSMMSTGETLVIERHGKPIGFFVPVNAKDRKRGRAALGRLGQAVAKILDETGLDEEQMAKELTSKRRR